MLTTAHVHVHVASAVLMEEDSQICTGSWDGLQAACNQRGTFCAWGSMTSVRDACARRHVEDENVQWRPSHASRQGLDG